MTLINYLAQSSDAKRRHSYEHIDGRLSFFIYQCRAIDLPGPIPQPLGSNPPLQRPR
ncbi:hypothetical protein BVI2075_140003 [Burkholderia vietnamiensis]|nr:hypothetical protein BVI2075_140003 [Burkholderia vietnamiensis]